MGDEDRRQTFRRWLIKAWTWADDESHPCASVLEELVSRSDEPDYPLWGVARKRGVIGDAPLADLLRARFGLPPQGPQTEWEKQINFQPVIYLDEAVWDHVQQSLGWANRDFEADRPDTFWLWSNAANQVRFRRRKKDAFRDRNLAGEGS